MSKYNKAREIVYDIAKNAKEVKTWTMSIPPQKEDSDLLLIEIIDEAQGAEKLKAKYEALKLLNYQLNLKIGNQQFLEKIVNPKLEEIRTEIADKFRHKMSDQSIVLNCDKEGKFSNPIVANTTDYEEALCPEDDSYQRDVCLVIPHIDDFREV